MVRFGALEAGFCVGLRAAPACNDLKQWRLSVLGGCCVGSTWEMVL